MTDAYNSLKTSVSNGKSAVASAITDKGISTSATATFDTMASNIRAISTGVTLSPVVADFTFYQTMFMGGVPPVYYYLYYFDTNMIQKSITDVGDNLGVEPVVRVYDIALNTFLTFSSNAGSIRNIAIVSGASGILKSESFLCFK